MTLLTISVPTSTQTSSGQIIEPGKFAMGLCVSDMELNPNPNDQPGYQYGIPSLQELTYYASQGLTLIRLNIAWPTLMATPNDASLTASYVQNIISVLNNANSVGIKCIVALFAYSWTQTATPAQFANLWTLLTTALVGKPGVYGYDLINEPNNMPNGYGQWPLMAQAAINAIRAIDTTSYIYVQGNNYSTPISYSTINPGSSGLIDPQNKLVFTVHCYLDRDNSGTHFDWSQEVAAGVTVNIGPQRMADFETWLKANKKVGWLGECGAGNQNSGWIQALDKMLTYCQTNKIQVTYWAAGSFWAPWANGGYGYSVEPDSSQYPVLIPAPQMAELNKFSNTNWQVSSPVPVTGTAPSGSKVYLIHNGSQVGTATADANGNWAWTLTTTTKGSYVLIASLAAVNQDSSIPIAAISLFLT
jgi:hypothetical protein